MDAKDMLFMAERSKKPGRMWQEKWVDIRMIKEKDISWF